MFVRITPVWGSTFTSFGMFVADAVRRAAYPWGWSTTIERHHVSDECIHGFEPGLCASCYPKPAPEVPVAIARTTTRTRAAAAQKTVAARTRSAAAGAARLDDVSDQRLYHLTHIRNLPAILESGTVFADQNAEWRGRPVVDIATPTTREDRRGTPVAGSGDATVASFVPFFLSPNASLWKGVRAGEPDYQLSPEVAKLEPADFVLLVSSVKTVFDSEAPFVVSDADAAHVLTRFATTREDAERSLRRLRADTISDSIDHAEFLVRDSVPFESISLIGVAHDKARAAVRAVLAAAPHSPKVAVYPPWFAAPEE